MYKCKECASTNIAFRIQPTNKKELLCQDCGKVLKELFTKEYIKLLKQI